LGFFIKKIGLESRPIMETFIHYFCHLGVPFFIAYGFFNKEWKRIYLILIGTMLVDLDHLLSDPIFQANSCSINFHPLHTYYAMIIYLGALFFRRPFNIIGLGLLFHMFADLIDCMMMYSNCKECFINAPAIKLLEMVSTVLGI